MWEKNPTLLYFFSGCLYVLETHRHCMRHRLCSPIVTSQLSPHCAGLTSRPENYENGVDVTSLRASILSVFYHYIHPTRSTTLAFRFTNTGRAQTAPSRPSFRRWCIHTTFESPRIDSMVVSPSGQMDTEHTVSSSLDSRGRSRSSTPIFVHLVWCSSLTPRLWELGL